MTEKELSLKLRMFNSVDRLIYINILLRNSLFNENQILGISIEDVIVDKSLIEYLSDCRMNLIHSILRETSFSSYKKKIKHLEPIFKDKYFEASLFIMDFDTWKEVMLYNLSILPKEKAKYEIIEYLERIVDLSYRLNSGTIPEFDTILFDYGSHSIHSGIEILSNSNYDFPLERYSAFLKSIDLSKISDNDTFDLIYRIKNLENRLSPEKVNHAPEYKIVLSKSASVNSLIKGLKELFYSINGSDVTYDLIKDFIFSVTKGQLENFDNRNFEFLKGKKNKSSRIDLVKFFVFLSHSGYILNHQTDVIKIISKYLNNNEDLGFGLRTLKGEIKKDNYFIFSDEGENLKSNRRINLISTVLNSNEEVKKKYLNSKANHDLISRNCTLHKKLFNL